jgi:hypothetical protein
MPEWINSYASIYYGVSIANDADDIIFEERYSISAKRAARETVIEKSEKLKKRKKRNNIS